MLKFPFRLLIIQSLGPKDVIHLSFVLLSLIQNHVLVLISICIREIVIIEIDVAIG